MFIKKAVSKDGVLSVVYEDGGNIYSVKSSEDPREALMERLFDLKATLLRHFEILTPEDTAGDYSNDTYKEVKISTATRERGYIADKFRPIGISHSQSEQNGESFKILGLYKGLAVCCPISTAAMTIPPSGTAFWNGESERNHPEYLTEPDCQRISAFLEEVILFLDGQRDQGELFDEEGNPVEEDA